MKKIIQYAWIFFIIFLCIYPMKLCPIWNGKEPEHRNQYEVMARSLMNGHLYMDLDVSQELLEMENPYDPYTRKKQEISFHDDHAYYKGHYYMYFGVVPVFLLFIPYRLIFGGNLDTYHATQFFTAFIIIGFFCFTNFLRKKFFPKMSNFICTSITTAFCLASVWYFVDAPALYCTAISSGVCMMVWCLYFYFRAVYDDISFNKKICFAVFGAITGALAFGCRPTVAIANIIAIPLFLVFLKTNKIEKQDRYKLIYIFLPYIIIGNLLMAYNYARFENPFEFGQRYQLTLWDQSDYTLLKGLELSKQINGFKTMFFKKGNLKHEFPYVSFGGIFYEFPIFLITIGAILIFRSARNKLRKNNLFSMVCISGIAVFIFMVVEIAMSPTIFERYHTDITYLLAMISFIIIGTFYIDADNAAIQKYNIT